MPKKFVAFRMLPSLPAITIIEMNLRFYGLQVNFNMCMTMTIWDLCSWTRFMHSCSRKENLGLCLVCRTESPKTHTPATGMKNLYYLGLDA